MTRTATPKLGAYTALAGLGLLGALVLGRPELVALAAPFAAVLVVGLSLAEAPRVRWELDLDRERQLEGETVEGELELWNERPIGRLEVLLDLPQGLVAETPNPVLVGLDWNDRRTLDCTIRCERWGAYLVGDLVFRSQDAFGLLVHEWTLEQRRPLKVYPRGESLRRLLRPLETQAFAGNQVPRARGQGIEFADVRPFVPGDSLRRINWRATARRNETWVTETHPERNSDVVIFLDTFFEARAGYRSTLDETVSAAASLAVHYLREKDRVGLVSFGGVINWLTVSSGVVQLYRVLDSLLDAEIFLSYAWKDLHLLPVRTLPPSALVIALSPLLDERGVRSLLDLRARGFDLALIEISPIQYAAAGEDEPEDELARRLWLLRRDELRARYLRLGVPVVEWRDGASLEAELEEVRAFKRHARFSRV
ncbi:MAG TPA: DUF58 domain-containing protein [Gaiellaceae bacterium]|nr:DUF58 domain-containing protein [Gaiellaceae bacterium]